MQWQTNVTFYNNIWLQHARMTKYFQFFLLDTLSWIVKNPDFEQKDLKAV